MKIFYVPFFITIYCQTISSIYTLYCAHSCAFGPVQLGSKDPIRTPCHTKDINITSDMCVVNLNINFGTSFIRGSLNDRPRTTNQSSSLHLFYEIYSTETLLFITYSCATTDNCDEEFVNETVSSSGWLTMNDTNLRNHMANLLFRTNSSGDIRCGNDLVCSSEENCYAKLSHNRSISSKDQIDFENNYPCDQQAGAQVRLNQYFYTSVTNREEILEVYCNRNGCNEKTTVDEVYRLFRKEFLLPLNYSSYTYVSNSNIHRMNVWITLVIFLISFFLYLFI